MTPVTLALIGVAIFILTRVTMKTKVETGYINGAPVSLELGSIGDGLWLRKDAAEAFNRMSNDAFLAGIGIKPSGPNSAFRTSEQQLEILVKEGRYGQGGYAAAVNKSPHQAGIAIDILNVNPWAENYVPTVRAWLLSQGPKYGWHNVGANFSSPEPWHFEFRG